MNYFARIVWLVEKIDCEKIPQSIFYRLYKLNVTILALQIVSKTLVISITFYSSSLNRAVDKYLSPVSGNITTIVFPLLSGLFAITVAA